LEAGQRDRRNRELAIKYHGLTCFGCGFNFGDVYGSLGEGFIEIHHLNPLHQNDDEVVINPRKDLIPLCSNCHRMIHRSRAETLSLIELKKIIEETLELHASKRRISDYVDALTNTK
jgi:5-methylcytosine-specific restriction enzyme A